jgi:hypothetical protein
MIYQKLFKKLLTKSNKFQSKTTSFRWIKLSDNCTEGIRYVSQKRDYSNVLLFDKSGRIAGVQVAIPHVPPTQMRDRYYEEIDFNGKKLWTLTAYFVILFIIKIG